MDRIGNLLTFVAPALPLLWARKESAALVLLPVSAAKVVEGVMLAGAGGTGGAGVWLPPPPQARSVSVKATERAAPIGRFIGPNFIATQAASGFATFCSGVMLPVNSVVYRTTQRLRRGHEFITRGFDQSSFQAR